MAAFDPFETLNIVDLYVQLICFNRYLHLILNHKWWGKFGHNLTVYTHSEYFGLSEKDGGRKTENRIKYNFQSIEVAVIVFVH